MTFQRCPICRNKVERQVEFPYYLCAECFGKVTDRNGNQIFYKPENSPKGYIGFYRSEPEKKYLYDICYINKEECKVYYDKKNIFIQPVNFLKFASRPEEPSIGEDVRTMPCDPEQRKARKKQIVVEKIIIPAGIATLFSAIPGLMGIFFLRFVGERNWIYYFSYCVISAFSLFFAYKIIQSRTRKFSNASYFRQHSYTFFLIGILSLVATVILSFADFWLTF
jgi:hypothetical protein